MKNTEDQSYHPRHLHPHYQEIADSLKPINLRHSRPLRVVIFAVFAIAVNFVCAPAAANSNQRSSYGLQVGTGICVIVGICFAALGILDYILERRS